MAVAVWIVAVLHSSAAAQPSPSVRIRNLLDDGRFAQAEALARAELSERESAFGMDSIEAAEALDLLVEARWRLEAADQEALELARRAVAIRERVLPSEADRHARSLGFLCRILVLRGEYEAARPICELGVSAIEKALGPGHLDVAENLSALGDLLYYTGDYSGSGQLHERARAILENGLGSDHPRVARSLWDWSSTLWERGDFEGAKTGIERALAIQQKALRADHPAMADTLHMMVNVLWSLGARAEATRLEERVAAIAETAFGPESPRLATILWNLGDCRIYYDLDYTDARRLLERALAIYERVYGPESHQFALSQSLLGRLLTEMGDYAEAERLIKRALDRVERILGPEHEEVAWVLLRLGRLNLERGDHPGASVALRRALSLIKKRRGPDHPYVGEFLISLGQNHHTLGEYDKAEALYREALGIYEKKSPEGASVTWALINIANSLRDPDRRTEAKALYERALALREQAWGPDHPVVAWTLAQFAEALVRGGETRKALTQALRVEEIGRNHLRLTARSLPERQALRYAAVRLTGMDVALSVVSHGTDRSLAGQVWDALIRSRALVLDEMGGRFDAVREADRRDAGPEDAALAAARQRLANLTIRGPGQNPPERFLALLDGARREKEEAEQALAERSLAFRTERDRERAGLAEIRSSLPPHSALVAYTRYLEHEIPSRQKASRPAVRTESSLTPSYAAFVMQAGDNDSHLVRLGTSAEIDRLVSRWKKAIARGDSPRLPKELEAEYRVAAVALRRKIWDPLAVHLAQSRRVFVVPDGSLHLVNLGTLPANGQDYLVETGPLIHYLSAERDLVPVKSEAKGGEGLLALGGPAFDDDGLPRSLAGGGGVAQGGEPVKMASASSHPGRRSACGDFQSMRFEPLPDSEREVNDVAGLWNDSGIRQGGPPHQPAESVVRLTGARASETAFKAQAPGRRVIHLATHGFFLGGRCASALDAARSGAGRMAGEYRPEPPPVVGENPLLLSGLALAGANRRASAGPEEDDGILTAEEVAGMDLSGVDWVVLSACDTGVGEFIAGEGMFGLQRAFQVAGARTVVTSLWPVEDEATRAWMRILYQERLKGASSAEAVRNANLKMIERLRRTGLPPHPYFWGAFVAVGE